MEQRRPLGLVGPLHVQIRDILRSHIGERRWRPGQPIPSETDLAREFGVSVGTMRKSIQGLELDGLVVRMQGRGTFVSPDPNVATSPSHSNFWIDDSRFVPVFEFISCERTAASTPVAKALKLRTADPVAHLRRKSITGGVTIGEDLFVSGALQADAPGLNLYDLTKPLRELGIEIDRVSESIRPGLCGSDWAPELGLSADDPVLHLERVSVDRNDVPVEVRYCVVVPGTASYRVAVA